MIVVTEIKYIEVPNNVHEIFKSTMSPVADFRVSGSDIIETAPISTETVRGRRFRNPLSEIDVILAASNDVDEVLGYPFQSLDDMEEQVSCVRARLRRFQALGFKGRLRFLLTKRLP